MCVQGQEKLININGNMRSVDLCIADLVQQLNNAGIETIACCCGHGKRPTVISLKNGKELFVAENYKQAREFDSLFPPLNELNPS